MTDQDLLDLDLAIARLVFGCKVQEDRFAERGWVMDKGSAWLDGWSTVPQYSTFSAFPLLLSKLEADHKRIEMDYLPLSTRPRWIVKIKEGGLFTWMGEAETLPIALALACRKAYESTERKSDNV